MPGASSPPGPRDHGYLRKNPEDESWTAVAVVQERVADGNTPTYTVLPSEMEAFVKTMTNGVLRVEHELGVSPVGVISDAWVSKQTVDAMGNVIEASTPQRMMAELRFNPKGNPVASYVIDQITAGNMKGVSLGMDATVKSNPDGSVSRELAFQELSVVFESDIPGSRLLPLVDTTSGTVLSGVGAVPQTVSVVASASKPWRIPRLDPKTKSTTWIREAPASDSKTVLCASLKFRVTGSASSNPLTFTSMAPTDQSASTTGGGGAGSTTPGAAATTPAGPDLTAENAALKAQLTQMKNDETVRKFWEEYGVALRALNEGASADESDVLTQAIATPANVLDADVASILRGMAMGYVRANQLGAAKRPSESDISVTAGGQDGNSKRSRLSDAEAALRRRWEHQAAKEASGTNHQQAWNQRLAEVGGSVVDPVTGQLVKNVPAQQKPAEFDLDWLVQMAVNPEGFAPFASTDVSIIASAFGGNGQKVVLDASTAYAVGVATGKVARRQPSAQTMAPPSAEDRETFRVAASAGFVL